MDFAGSIQESLAGLDGIIVGLYSSEQRVEHSRWYGNVGSLIQIQGEIL